MPIHILSPTVAAQIAAGEVVERPASVVKELVENALDAGASRITVEIRGGGLQEIKVQDNGTGISADDVERAFTRHATSKLTHAEELWSIATLGFRGEALPSIASVSQVVCITRTNEEESGTELRIAGGELQARSPRGCLVGTSMSVRQLFYNTPVRREYLRSEATEMNAISMVVQQYALAYPHVHMTLLLDGKLALQTSGNGDMRDVVVNIYGLDVARQLLPLEAHLGAEAQAIHIHGLISPPGVTRSSRHYLHFIVNHRVVAARSTLVYVVENAYHTLLMKGRYPLAVIDIQVDPAAIDVNVHPTKSEVKFRYHGSVMSVLGRSIREALLHDADIPSWKEPPSPTTDEPHHVEQTQQRLPSIGTTLNTQSSSSDARRANAWNVGGNVWNTAHSRWDVGSVVHRLPTEQYEQQQHTNHADRPNNQHTPHTPTNQLPTIHRPEPTPETVPVPNAIELPSDISHILDTSSLPPLRIIGQVGLTYIVAESPVGMYLIDQHATHERIAYERLMAQRGSGNIESQELLLPHTITLPPEAAQLLLEQHKLLTEWGFRIDEWGDGMVRVRAIPAILAEHTLESALLDVVEHLAQRGGSTPNDWREEMLITLACHTSVRAGQTLALDEMRELLRQLEQCANPHTCPHGRPIMVLLTPGQLERQFGRQG